MKNHPYSGWKDEETWNLRKDKTRYLDRDIRFNGLGDAEDHEMLRVGVYPNADVFRSQIRGRVCGRNVSVLSKIIPGQALQESFAKAENLLARHDGCEHS